MTRRAPSETARKTRGDRLSYWIGRVNERPLLEAEFAHALKRSVRERLRRGVVHTYKPVIDDAPYRIFQTMQDYARWCERRLPPWLGYGKTA